MPMATFVIDGTTMTHSALFKRSCGMASGRLRISSMTRPAFSRRPCSLLWATRVTAVSMKQSERLNTRNINDPSDLVSNGETLPTMAGETACSTRYTSSSLRISRKHPLGARRILEFMLRSYPVLSIKAVCVASIDVELVGPVGDVLGRYDDERRIVCVINHSNNLSARDRQVHGCAPGCGVLYEPLALAYPLRRSRDVLKTTLRRSSRWRWLARSSAG